MRSKGVPDLSSADKLTVIPENLEILEGFLFMLVTAVKHFSSFLSGIAGKKYASSSLSSGLSVYFEIVVTSSLKRIMGI